MSAPSDRPPAWLTRDLASLLAALTPAQRAVVERLAAGTDPATVARETAPEIERSIWERCALVRAVDAQVYRVLTADLDPARCPAFEAFVQAPEAARADDPAETGGGARAIRAGLERVPRQSARYTLSDAVRHDLWRPWLAADRRADLTTWSVRLAAHYAERGADAEFDYVYHLIVASPEDAVRHFSTRFDEADARFDLARCFALLEVLRERTTLLRGALPQVQRDRWAYYGARALFAEDVYQTARFFAREEATRAFETFLSDPAHWIFHLHAPGGLGKTLFLRWTIARQLIPEPRRVPCVRIDFDFIAPDLLAQAPWLLVAPLAEQLNQQLPGAPLSTLLLDLRVPALLLRRPRGRDDEARVSPGVVERITREVAGEKDVPGRVASQLQSVLKPGQPVVVVLDTLEDTLLHDPTALLRALDYLAGLRARLPNLRLVLTSRYNLLDRLPEFAARAREATLTHELRPLEPEEGVQFLLTCGLDCSHPLAAVVARAEGNPFKLSLLAELCLADPDLDAAAVETLPSVDFAYLVDRVVKRIPEMAVRWVVRYGVIPRQLTPAYLEQVMWPELARSLTGTQPDDVPRGRLPEGTTKYLDRDWWTTTGALPTPADLWAQVKKYTSGRGWILSDTGDPDTLRFHSDVVVPMRKIVGRQPISEKLHRASAAWADQRAAADLGTGPPGAARRSTTVATSTLRRLWRSGARTWMRRSPTATARRWPASHVNRLDATTSRANASR